MKKYKQLDMAERAVIAAMRMRRISIKLIAETLGRDRSTIYREVQRNKAVHDGAYRYGRAHECAGARRKRSRRNLQFGEDDLRRVQELLENLWSPEQISGYLKRIGELSISHETIYRYVWSDWKKGGKLHLYLRGARKKYRKRYGRKDSRGRVSGKRSIQERPAIVEERARIGDWEIDTVLGNKTKPCIVTLVERKTGYLLIGKLEARTVEETNRATIALIREHPERFRTITSDNGTEFHGYKAIEAATGIPIYFATPHHSWERGTNENTNGLIRQYLPKRQSMAKLTQPQCNLIAEHLNYRPRKRHEYKTPHECFAAN